MLRSLVSSSRGTMRLSNSIRFRAVATTPKRLSDAHAPPALLGDGAPAGSVPTDHNQATGLERLQLLGHVEGVDVFDMQPLEVLKLGTKKDPIIVKSYAPLRQIGCTGFPVDSHDTLWFNLRKDKEFTRCSECGSVYKMDYQGVDDPHVHH